jgi:transketolase
MGLKGDMIMNNIATQRNAFFDKLYEVAKNNQDVVIVVADMSAPSLDKFRKEMPSQFINVGIAEQNAIVIGSGLALAGKKVFVYAIAPFITLRCLDQIRVSNSIMNIPITIIGMGTGLSYDSDGPTHHLIEDISILRSLPNIKINNLTDNVMAATIAEKLCDIDTTNYVRLDKDFTSDVYDVDFDFSKGISKFYDEKENIIISTGPIFHTINKIINDNSLNVGLIDIFQIPINESVLIDMLKDAKKIITIEEHFLPGGLGSAVCEILNDNKINIFVKRLGLDIKAGYKNCYKYGGREIIRSYSGLDSKSIYKTIVEYFNIS